MERSYYEIHECYLGCVKQNEATNNRGRIPKPSGDQVLYKKPHT